MIYRTGRCFPAKSFNTHTQQGKSVAARSSVPVQSQSFCLSYKQQHFWSRGLNMAEAFVRNPQCGLIYANKDSVRAVVKWHFILKLIKTKSQTMYFMDSDSQVKQKS